MTPKYDCCSQCRRLEILQRHSLKYSDIHIFIHLFTEVFKVHCLVLTFLRKNFHKELSYPKVLHLDVSVDVFNFNVMKEKFIFTKLVLDFQPFFVCRRFS